MKIFFKAILFIINKINSFIKIFVVFTGIVMFVIVLMGIVSRYVLICPFKWVEELARVCFVIIVFFGMCLVLEKRENVRIDFLRDKFPIVIRRISDTIYDIFIIAFISIFIYQGYLLTIEAKNHFTESLGFSKMYIYMIIPFTASIMLIQVVKRIVNDFLDLRERRNK